jgi:hypothetical protein
MSRENSAKFSSGPSRSGTPELRLGDGRCRRGCAFGMSRDGLCPACLGLGDLVFLPSGDAALTRRASTPRAVPVVEFNRRRKRDERRGTLVEPAALEKAREACAADAVERAEKAEKRRARDAVKDAEFVAAFAERIRLAYPGCPDAEAIARHACEKHSGRVGRTAAAKELDPEKVELAVRAHARHLYTDYDRLRDARVNKRDARAQVRGTIESVLARWRGLTK